MEELGQDLLIVVVEHLKNEIGVNSPEDFKYIQESDLPMLKPIQRTRLLDILKKETSDCKTADTTKNRTPELPAIISSVITHFKDNEASVFQVVETPRSDYDLERQLVNTPCLIAVGTSLLMADRFMLSIDGVIINNNITNFRVALVMLFSSYYIFNIQYPSDAEATLEFIQRCMVGINPDRGHKAEKKKNRTHHTNELY
ncbi:hypothetical protein Pmani_008346 [Petrolisthes manimaculis]|uniref:Uncharacterized protein n=1 Tax=Petrolisthes manimaculis TaxID=1843537 RepID=A0AAE1UEQ2_9EUCA|nr:hypothetical protein Pmani_008346 [Petrolisthes manimaculis]